MAHPCRLCFLVVIALRVAGAPSSSDQKLIGEYKQEVVACACMGSKKLHGLCGFHYFQDAISDTPWCRTKYGCGYTSKHGSWTHCNEKAVERRRAPDGQLYTAKTYPATLPDYKSGKTAHAERWEADQRRKQWDAASLHVERRLAKNNKAYTVAEFRNYYLDAFGERGWVEKWEAARPEQRKAKDGFWYRWEKFVEFYGAEKAWDMWNNAQTARAEL
eukprot:gnl/TRDRNA2_/TRDRNA2_83443_c0_seq1.p1 gnl/TRDRNA2_/TRDRNA2_83443_c0~~gnl/TRDRNA2_/TRDRNA2_83443_c0_seq1.p1  ORF type:complete len:217 (-),score=37.65 gnl/TRDRNA2_/TRDRNA2_83443_c0_seq1:126-776(-)